MILTIRSISKYTPTDLLQVRECSALILYIARTYSYLWLLDVIKSIEPLIHGEPPGPTSDKAFGRRLYADGTSDRHGPARLRPQPSDRDRHGPARLRAQPSGRDRHGNYNNVIGNSGTRSRDKIKPGPSRGAVKASQSDCEHFDLDAMSDDDPSSSSGGEELLRGHNFQRKMVRIKMSPVKPAHKSKPSYMELSDSEEAPLTSVQDVPKGSNHAVPTAQAIGQDMVDHEAEMSLREASDGKGKARAISKRKAAPEVVEHVRGRTADVRDPVYHVD